MCTITDLHLWTPNWAIPQVRPQNRHRNFGSAWAVTATSALNLASHTGTPTALVERARQALLGALSGVQGIQWLEQVHSTLVVEVTAAYPVPAFTADAVVTSVPKLACAVLTADCLPLLLIDQSIGKVAAVHAGWRGLAAGIVQQALAHFPEPGRVQASIGPCISAACFEVGAEVLDAFAGREAFFKPSYRSEHWFADLPGMARATLLEQGLNPTAIATSGRCTYSESVLPSYRQNKTPVRLASLIWLLD